MTTIDIYQFCSPDDVREYCMNPFNQGGWTIATEGHVLIAVPEIESFRANVFPCDSRALKLLEQDCVHSWLTMPAFEIPADAGLKDCGTCAGTGKCEIKDCPECGGSGEVEWDTGYNSYEDDCLSCLGSGEVATESQEIDCIDCDGSGRVDNIHDNIPILGIPFQAKYVRLINNHPGVEVALSANYSQMIVFRQIIDGEQVARGAMMGLRLWPQTSTFNSG